jgi:hypothetical protein
MHVNLTVDMDEESRSVFHTIRREFGSSLRKLSLELPEAITWSGVDLFPLLTGLHLTELNGSAFGNAFDLTDASLASLGQACPQLEVLILTRRGEFQYPRATLAGLIHLLRICPAIRQLTMGIKRL